MTKLPKLLQSGLYLALACLAAGLFGMLHNQVSYTLGPVYFHEFKFIQFRVSPDFPPRLAASIIGWKASWWMGLVAGVPLFMLALMARTRAEYARLCRMGVTTVLTAALAFAALAAAVGLWLLTPENLPDFSEQWQVSNPLGFARAGAMHDASYLGCLAGGVLALIRISMQLWRARKAG